MSAYVSAWNRALDACTVQVAAVLNVDNVDCGDWTAALEHIRQLRAERDALQCELDALSDAVIRSQRTEHAIDLCPCGDASGADHECDAMPDFASPEMHPIDPAFPDHIPALGRFPSERP